MLAIASIALTKAQEPKLEQPNVDSLIQLNVETLERIDAKTADMQRQLDEHWQRMTDMEAQRYAEPSAMNAFIGNLVPLLFLVCSVLVVYIVMAWLYKIRKSRFEIMEKYIERGEQVPEWLIRSNAPQPNETSVGQSKGNRVVMLVFICVIFFIAFITFINGCRQYQTSERIVFFVATAILGIIDYLLLRQYLNGGQGGQK